MAAAVMAAVVVWPALPALSAEAAAEPKAAPEPKAAAEPKAAPKPMLKLRAKSIVFNRAKGDLRLEGEVHVTRTIGEQVLTVDCDEMTAKLQDGKMQSVLATGNVKLLTEDVEASGTSADFDFVKNIITLRGPKDKPASMRTLKPPVIVSTGPTIIFNVADQGVVMPDGGDTSIPLEPSAESKKKEK
ncbi:MAG: hypothetical protein ABIF82_01955 [Planctomycetota bacterium]